MEPPIQMAREHDLFPNTLKELLGDKLDVVRSRISDAYKSDDKRFLGINPEFKAGYYIGCAWLLSPLEDKTAIAVQVAPKIENVDYIRMFLTALNVRSLEEAEYFSDYYHIDFNSPAIEIKSEENLITPLLLLHYIALLEQLSHNGLRRNYIRREENLQSKIRGKILFNRHLKQNIFNKREDRIFCAYQEYTIDSPENRLLKKALLYAKKELETILSLNDEIKDGIYSKLAPIERAFESVSEDVSLAQVNFVKSSKLYRHYDEALKVAKMILQSIDYEILDNKKEHCYKVHPYWIDMPRVYEMYVLSLLRKVYGSEMIFQAHGYRKTRADYIKLSDDEKLIIDAKYKPRYSDGNVGILNDIQEMSRYARDKKILGGLKWNPKEECEKGSYFPKCLIIYPDPNTVFKKESDGEYEKDEDAMKAMLGDFPKEGILSDKEHVREIPGFEEFYKIAVPLPLK